MSQSPTKQELGKRAVEILQKAKEVLPHLNWKWSLQDKYQEWDAEVKEGDELTLLDLITLYTAFTEYLEGWKVDWATYEEIRLSWKPLSKWKDARELTLSIVFHAEDMQLQVRSDVGMVTPYDDADPNDASGWVTPDWYKPGNGTYEYWQKELEKWDARGV